MFEVAQLIWHNGRIIPHEQAAPSIASHSLHLGIGVFDGLRAFWNGTHYYIHALDEHIARLRENAITLEMEIPWSLKELKAGILTLLAEIPQTNYYLRPIVYRGQPKITINERQQMQVDVAILAVTAPRGIIKSLRCHISPIERVSNRAIPVSAKICGAYVNSYLVRTHAEASGFDEGIMLDREGKIAEAATANLFFIQQDTIVTPILTPDIFPGITRSTLLKVAHSLGIKVIERNVYPEALGNFVAAFSCATFSEIKPIITIDSHQYDSLNNSIFCKLLKAYQEITYQ